MAYTISAYVTANGGCEHERKLFRKMSIGGLPRKVNDHLSKNQLYLSVNTCRRPALGHLTKDILNVREERLRPVK